MDDFDKALDEAKQFLGSRKDKIVRLYKDATGEDYDLGTDDTIKAALSILNLAAAKRLASLSRRLELVTCVLLFVTVALLVVTILLLKST